MYLTKCAPLGSPSGTIRSYRNIIEHISYAALHVSYQSVFLNPLAFPPSPPTPLFSANQQPVFCIYE